MVCPGAISMTSTLSKPSWCNSCFNCAGGKLTEGLTDFVLKDGILI